MQEHEVDAAAMQAFLDELHIDDPPPTLLRGALDPLLLALARIVLEGTPGDGSYVILECEGCFVQFAGSRGDTTLWCEAVSNYYLPPHRQLAADQVAQLLELGFAEPACAPDVSRSTASPNFHAQIDVSTEADLYRAGLLAVTMLCVIYKCCEESEIGLTLRIAVWPAKEDVA